MKGGVVLALGVLRALAERRGDFAEVALLLVCDEEWRTAPFAHAERFAGWDACLCFEAGELTPDGARGRRRAAQGRGHDPGPRARAARRTRARRPTAGATRCSRSPPRPRRSPRATTPDGPERLTAVPTVLHAGDAFNVVPGRGELVCDLRADDDAAIIGVLDAIPREVGGVTLEPELMRLWPGMDAEAATVPLLRAGRAPRSGAPVAGVRRGGASDASHLAAGDPAHGRRARPARRQGAQPGRVRARRVAAQPRRGRARVAAAALAG